MHYVLEVRIKTKCVASLVAQWWRVRLPIWGTQFWSPVWGDPTCREATKPVGPNYQAGAGAGEPQGLSWRILEPAPRQEKAPQLQRSLQSNEDPARTKINNKYSKVWMTDPSLEKTSREPSRAAGKASWPRPPIRGLAWTAGLFVGPLSLTTDVSSLLSSGLWIILSRWNFRQKHSPGTRQASPGNIWKLLFKQTGIHGVS